MSAILRYAVEFYLLLDSQAKENEYHERVFIGKVTDLYKELGASSTYYSSIRKLLVDTGSITFLTRGTSKQDSEIRLNGLSENILADPLTPPPGTATLGAEVERRLARLESWRETTGGLNIADALRNMEQRLTKLEGKSKGKSEAGGKV